VKTLHGVQEKEEESYKVILREGHCPSCNVIRRRRRKNKAKEYKRWDEKHVRMYGGTQNVPREEA
jgi:hypothetical protein